MHIQKQQFLYLPVIYKWDLVGYIKNILNCLSQGICQLVAERRNKTDQSGAVLVWKGINVHIIKGIIKVVSLSFK
jgi:hypothetical protein